MRTLLWKISNIRSPLLKENIYQTAAISLTHQCSADCSYCYAKDFYSLMPEPMSIEHFQKVLTWLLRHSQCNYISLLGGEPTSHPAFSEICSITKQTLKNYRHLRMCLFTKASLLTPESLSLITQCGKRFIVQLHFSDEELRVTEKYLHLQANISHLKRYRHPFLFRIVLSTVTPSETELNEIITFLSSYARWNKDIRLRFSFDDYTNISENIITNMAETSIRLIKKALKHNIYPALIRAIPRCFFSPNDARKYKDFLMFSCIRNKENAFPHIVINPDLSSFACCAAHLRIKKNVLSYESLEELQKDFAPHFDVFYKNATIAKCQTCKDFLDQRCLGVCLGHRIGNKKIIDIEI